MNVETLIYINSVGLNMYGQEIASLDQIRKPELPIQVQCSSIQRRYTKKQPLVA